MILSNKLFIYPQVTACLTPCYLATLSNTLEVIENTPRVFKISFGVITQASV